MAERKVETIVRYSPMDIPKIIRAHWNGEPKEPVHFVGEPSTVKSASVYDPASSRTRAMATIFSMLARICFPSGSAA